MKKVTEKLREEGKFGILAEEAEGGKKLEGSIIQISEGKTPKHDDVLSGCVKFT